MTSPLNGHKFDQALGDGEGQGSLARNSPWGSQKVRHNGVTEQQLITESSQETGSQSPVRWKGNTAVFGLWLKPWLACKCTLAPSSSKILWQLAHSLNYVMKQSSEQRRNQGSLKCKWKPQWDISPVRMSVIKKTRGNKCWHERTEKRTLARGWWECKLVQPLWKTVWSFLKKLKLELPCDPEIPFLGIYPEKLKSPPQRDIKIAKRWKKLSVPRQMNGFFFNLCLMHVFLFLIGG